tara:strand:+ start:1381 stop:2439 length:1059 start_codon:yes stop_codon:yes gene_type:complete
MSNNRQDDLHADEVMGEGAHDMKNAEAQSVSSVSKAEDGVKSSPKRKLDKTGKDEPAPPGATKKPKAPLVNAGYKAIASMKKEDLEALLDQLGVDVEEITEEEEVAEASYDFSDDLTALVENEATLSDEFKVKSAIIFETAIKSKISSEVERLEDEYQSRLDEELDTTRSDMVEKVDSYLNYVVEQWMEENKIAVEQGLRTEIAEGFMNSLKDLFVESYIDVPESKVDLVDELAESVATLEEKLNAKTASVLEMTSKLEAYQRESVVQEHAGNMASTEVEKLKSLVESLDFEDEETFSSKVKTVKESYFKKETTTSDSQVINEEADDTWVDDTAEVNSSMSQYLNAIKKSNK